MERVIIDMDEVIADPMGDMIEWYSKTHQLEVDRHKMLGGSWVKGFPEQHHELIIERLLSAGFFRHLPVIKDSIEVLREMNERYEIFIVSAAMEFPNSLRDKLDWLLDHFPFFTWKQIAFCGDKRLICGDYMIDDHVKNLRHFKGKPYIFTSAHNLDITDYERLNNWQEVGEVFLKNR
ncbi:MAG TPA: 5'(3')-deoxyribonucleotidase [Chitinophagaceae bacterium]|nr:5'(3')-deoxyribonucleotidase [Chitinophagaceae bacterium]